jgi:hypothetical protein
MVQPYSYLLVFVHVHLLSCSVILTELMRLFHCTLNNTILTAQAKELASAVTAHLRSKYNAKQRAAAIALNGISTPDASITSIIDSDITNGVNVYPVYTGILHILASDGLWTDAIKIIEVSDIAHFEVCIKP